MASRKGTNIAGSVTQTQLLVPESLTALVDSQEKQKLRLLLNDQHASDLAECFSALDPFHRLACFRLLDLDNASAVLSELGPETQERLLKDLGATGLVPLISSMEAGDAVDLLEDMAPEEAQTIISRITDKDVLEDIEEMLSYKENTAGRIMSTEYLALNEKMTAEQALADLRQKYEHVEEDIYDIYVVDEKNVLSGRVSLKELITANSTASIGELMETDVYLVFINTDQEEAARKLGRYDLLSLPVVDEGGRLKGVITADDVIDVLEEEATEDIYKSSGINTSSADDSEQVGHSVRRAFAARLPWLIVTLLIETGSASVINHFDDVLRQTVEAAAFMPVLSGVTGSVATQSTCIIIRGAGKGPQTMKRALRNLWREAKVGMLLGLACGLLTSMVSLFTNPTHHHLGIIVGVSLFATMTVGVILGTVMPMLFEKLGIEPAHASGPFITSILDVCTITIYLTIVHTFLSLI